MHTASELGANMKLLIVIERNINLNAAELFRKKKHFFTPKLTLMRCLLHLNDLHQAYNALLLWPSAQYERAA